MIGGSEADHVIRASINKEDLIGYFMNHLRADIMNIMKGKDLFKHYSLFLNFLDLIDFNIELADRILNKPQETLSIMERLLIVTQERLLKDLLNDKFRTKLNVHIRLTNLPYFTERNKLFDNSIDVNQGNLFTFSGSIVKSSTPKIIQAYKIFECLKCHKRYKQYADLSQYGQCPKPDVCTFINNGISCFFTKFSPVEGNGIEEKTCSSSSSSSFPLNVRIDYQELRLQENTRMIPPGSIPKSLVLIAICDLVDICKLGDEILFCGTIITRWKNVKVGSKVDLEYCLYANNITILNQQIPLSFDSQAVMEDALCFWEEHQGFPIRGRNVIINSFAKGLYGMFLTRLAVLLTIIGGSNIITDEESATNRVHRKEGHLLLVGDPGTFKSQFLAAAANLCIRSVVTSGSGSTSAGLTCSAVKEQGGGGWHLEAGAFVLADQGICCVDEFNLIRSSDRTSIHEAMEQQTISVAKAGLICKLNTRCSVMAACNAKGKFENDVGITANTAIASPLLSRFDLILILSDRHDSEWDERMANQLFSNLSGRERKSATANELEDVFSWSHQRLQNYIYHVRQNLNPKMSKGAQVLLSKYYQKQRSDDARDSARTTVRLLESLIRLAQAHAKLMFHSELVTIDDAISAVVLMETSLQTQTFLDQKPDLFADADEDADVKFKLTKDQILKKLSINMIIIEEMEENI